MEGVLKMHVLSLAKLNTINSPWYEKLAARLLGKVVYVPLGDDDYAVMYVFLEQRYHFDKVKKRVTATSRILC